jgi:hypothetical protein
MGGRAVGDVLKLGLEGKSVPVGERVFIGDSLTRGLVLDAGLDDLPRS